jgi:DeoR family transcriptional regulator, aga operon transcriptional repressor
MPARSLSNFERQQQLLRFIQQQGRASVADLCTHLNASPATIRRDLDALAQSGQIQRVRGAALPTSRSLPPAPPELPALERMAEQADEKVRIGEAAAEMVSEGETIFLGSGTTTLQVALVLRTRALASPLNLTVITNSLAVMNVLAGIPAQDSRTGLTLISLGGLFRPTELSFTGHVTEQALAELRADRVFIGVRAVDPQAGLTNQDLIETLTDRAILKIGRQVILLADHTKCGRITTALLAPITAVHTLITDSATPAEFVNAATLAGVAVISC